MAKVEHPKYVVKITRIDYQTRVPDSRYLDWNDPHGMLMRGMKNISVSKKHGHYEWMLQPDKNEEAPWLTSFYRMVKNKNTGEWKWQEVFYRSTIMGGREPYVQMENCGCDDVNWGPEWE